MAASVKFQLEGDWKRFKAGADITTRQFVRASDFALREAARGYERHLKEAIRSGSAGAAPPLKLSTIRRREVAGIKGTEPWFARGTLARAIATRRIQRGEYEVGIPLEKVRTVRGADLGRIAARLEQGGIVSTRFTPKSIAFLQKLLRGEISREGGGGGGGRPAPNVPERSVTIRIPARPVLRRTTGQYAPRFMVVYQARLFEILGPTGRDFFGASLGITGGG